MNLIAVVEHHGYAVVTAGMNGGKVLMEAFGVVVGPGTRGTTPATSAGG
jgi:hypothetical protein